MGHSLTKLEMSEQLQQDLGFSRKEAKDLVDCFFDEIVAALEGGEQVKISGFGNFELRDKKSRPGRNPKTGEPYNIEARRVVTFKAGRKLRDRIDAYAGESPEPVQSLKTQPLDIQSREAEPNPKPLL